MLLRPEVERDGGKFVHQRVSEAVLSEVDGLDVGAAGVAALDTDVGQLGRGEDRKLGVFFLAASGADEPAKLPFREAYTAKKAAAASVALLAQHADGRFAIAERAPRAGIALEL